MENPKLRERDLAIKLGISEAELVAAHCGGLTDDSKMKARRLDVDLEALLKGAKKIGEVMVLTRNESAVHEKIGHYEKIFANPAHAMTLGENIDLRIFQDQWKFGFAVEKITEDQTRRSLQFFDQYGTAVHKIHLRPDSDLDAYETLCSSLSSDEVDLGVQPEPTIAFHVPKKRNLSHRLEERWAAMTDVHQFIGILNDLDLSRYDAVDLIGETYARQVQSDQIPKMLEGLAERATPIMCFVGSRGCIQIHSGPISQTKAMGPWFNIMDPTFHLHLRTDHIDELWVVQKPTKDGHVTSVEAYNSDKQLIIQFFGKRREGETELTAWRECVDALPSFSSKPQSNLAQENADA